MNEKALAHVGSQLPPPKKNHALSQHTEPGNFKSFELENCRVQISDSLTWFSSVPLEMFPATFDLFLLVIFSLGIHAVFYLPSRYLTIHYSSYYSLCVVCELRTVSLNKL